MSIQLLTAGTAGFSETTLSSLREKYKELVKRVASEESPVSIEFLRELQGYLDLVQSHPEKETPEIESIYLKRQLSRLGLHLKTDDISSSLSDGDIIECYNLEHQQIFRNFEFFVHCSYTITELTSSTWPDLFERSQSAVEQMQIDVMRILASEGPRITSRSKPHYMRERAGRQRCFEITLQYGWPLFDRDEKCAGYISTQRARPIATGNVTHIF